MSDYLKELDGETRRLAIAEAFGRVAATSDGSVVFRLIAEAGGLFDPIVALKDDGSVDHDDLARKVTRRNFALEFFQFVPKVMVQIQIALLPQEKHSE